MFTEDQRGKLIGSWWAMSLFRPKGKNGSVINREVEPSKDARLFRVDLSFSTQIGQNAEGGLAQQDAAFLLNKAADLIESLRARCEAAESRNTALEEERRRIVVSAEAEIGSRDGELAATAVRTKALEEALERVSIRAWDMSRALDQSQLRLEEWAVQARTLQIADDKLSEVVPASPARGDPAVVTRESEVAEKEAMIEKLTQSYAAAQARAEFLQWRLNGFEDMKRLRRELGDPVPQAA